MPVVFAGSAAIRVCGAHGTRRKSSTSDLRQWQTGDPPAWADAGVDGLARPLIDRAVVRFPGPTDWSMSLLQSDSESQHPQAWATPGRGPVK